MTTNHDVLNMMVAEMCATIDELDLESNLAKVAATDWLNEYSSWQELLQDGTSLEYQVGYLTETFASAVNERQRAVVMGAEKRTDPRWAGSALVESWAGLELGALKSRWSASEITHAVQTLTSFCHRHLTKAERSGIQDFASRKWKDTASTDISSTKEFSRGIDEDEEERIGRKSFFDRLNRLNRPRK